MYSTKKANRFVLIMMLIFITVPYLLSPIVTLLVNERNFNFTMTHQVILSQWILIFVPLVIYLIITQSPLNKTILFKRLDWITTLLVIALGFTIQPIVMIVNLISQLFVENQIGNVLVDMIDMPYWLILFLVAVSPAIVEELFMRGIVLSNYRNKTLLTACLINGLFFGIFHLNINQFLYAFILGAVFCFVVHVTESIFSTMIIHFIINGSNVTLLKLIYWLSDYIEEASPGFQSQLELSSEMAASRTDLLIVLAAMIPIFLLGLVLSILVLWGLLKHHKKLDVIKANPPSYELLNLPLSNVHESHQKVVTVSFICIIGIFIIITLNNDFHLYFIESFIRAIRNAI